MALVRDPAVAARYAADPAGTLADAHLTGVTVTDVENLIPVVTDSLAAATPSFGAAIEAANVWTSGAAAAAFDAFDIHIPAPAPVDHPVVTVPPVQAPLDGPMADGPAAPDTALAAEPQIPDHQPLDAPTTEWVDDPGWHHPVHDPQPDHPADPGLDVF